MQMTETETTTSKTTTTPTTTPIATPEGDDEPEEGLPESDDGDDEFPDDGDFCCWDGGEGDESLEEEGRGVGGDESCGVVEPFLEGAGAEGGEVLAPVPPLPLLEGVGGDGDGFDSGGDGGDDFGGGDVVLLLLPDFGGGAAGLELSGGGSCGEGGGGGVDEDDGVADDDEGVGGDGGEGDESGDWAVTEDIIRSRTSGFLIFKQNFIYINVPEITSPLSRNCSSQWLETPKNIDKSNQKKSAICINNIFIKMYAQNRFCSFFSF